MEQHVEHVKTSNNATCHFGRSNQRGGGQSNQRGGFPPTWDAAGVDATGGVPGVSYPSPADA
eukprot:957252-Prorocentrum_minimum.AAC.2